MTFIAGGSNQNIGIMKMPIKTNNWDLETLWDQFRTNTGSPPLYCLYSRYCEKECHCVKALSFATVQCSDDYHPSPSCASQVL